MRQRAVTKPAKQSHLFPVFYNIADPQSEEVKLDEYYRNNLMSDIDYAKKIEDERKRL